MTKDRRLTAEELNRDLTSDVDYQRRLQERDKRAEETRVQERQLVAELRTLGAFGDSLAEVVQRNAPLSGDIASVLVQHLRSGQYPLLREPVVRALGAAGNAFDASPLAELFESSDSDSLRWAIANTFAELRPLNLGAWLAKALQNPAFGKAREMLTLAVARSLPSKEACKVLRASYAELPGHTAKALGECGGASELEFLRSEVAKVNGWVKKEMERAIRSIERRLKSS